MSETKIQDQKLTGFWKILLLIMTSVGIIMTINQIFMLKILGFMPLDNAFLYYLMAIFLPFAFIIFPKNRKIKWYDIVLFCIAFVIGIYFGLNGFKINQGAWEWYAPTIPTVFSIIMWILVIEAVRRTSGKALTIVCIIFSLFPLITGSMPGFLQGNGYSFLDLARMHILSRNSIAGMPLQVFGQLLIGFMIFGVVLKNSGCGDFFLNISIGLLGKNPGGPAKVACVSSALLGSMSGSVLTNVVTTGSMTIPAMIKTGYKPKYAGAIEACASTGATIMPPIMGAAAFVMANFLRVPYVTIIIAAIIPALLYFWGIYVQ
ncbi:MAG: TRAP transporter large permease subunit, partial [Clostridiaceae bacterium]|nr:TRAP transporter large permease subunit [Clostridiaceae bacterium]